MYWALEVQEDADLVTNRGGGFEHQLADTATLDWELEFVKVQGN